jgi:glutamate N-acetyltransferase/amino-acid N-acetyltransferase
MKGVKFAGIVCGIKKNRKNDIGLAIFDKPAIACGVFTRNSVKAPCVGITKDRIKHPIKVLLVVSGNACVCIREANADTLLLSSALARKLGIKDSEIALAATGVIGIRMPVDKAVRAYPVLIDSISESHKPFSEAVTTTDAFEKVAEKSFFAGRKKISILGIGKGAGMIAPDMATMLMFIFTDAAISRGALNAAFKESVAESFNCISVDGDTSTNDMALVFATGTADNEEIKSNSAAFNVFRKNLKQVCLELAKMVVIDGEGATKLIEIRVKGAKTIKDAKQVAKTVANSQLVKTAFFGQDPNWGRIMAAVGRSGIKLVPELIDVEIQKMHVVKKGYEAKGFDEKKLQSALKSKEISVVINLNNGKAETVFYTSDLTFDYIKVNSAYRT